jgi:hypothetical protein
MSRGLWFLAGSALGAYGVVRARRVAEALTYDGLHDRLSGLFVGARLFSAELRAGTAEKEAELRYRLALHDQQALPGPSVAPPERPGPGQPETTLSLLRGTKD